ncbi:hypothetical protein CHS0354_029205 [Potamilus streckersoni]|uniref:Uncharacterized protein n=1 Tax=Potamilus streckersoni TaxID=2493646 RepID=A0AAE0TG39_9BIVA|nr:hypothetical protein CHS0354_029205 [Potamilus streckersoni]
MEVESNSSNLLQVPGHESSVTDDYTAAIELSNACREFYRNRVKATENFKQRLSTAQNKPPTSKTKTSIDEAMERLNFEMASLMDQDLSLMKQLLTLNESIEELKSKRLYYVSKDSLRTSSQELHTSDWSMSETEMYEEDAKVNKLDHEKEHSELRSIQNRLSIESLSRSKSFSSRHEHEHRKDSHSSLTEAKTNDVQLYINGVPVKVIHGQQRSIDSGYGDDEHFLNSYHGPLEVII